MTASGLPGEAGGSHAGGNEDENVAHVSTAPPGYTGCMARGKPAISAPPLLLPLRSHPAMNSFEINRILGALLGTCLALLCRPYRGRSDLYPRRCQQSRAMRSPVKDLRRSKPRARKRRPNSRSRLSWPPPPSSAGRRSSSSARSATTSGRTRTQGRPRSLRYRARTRARVAGGVQLLGSHEGQGAAHGRSMISTNFSPSRAPIFPVP